LQNIYILVYSLFKVRDRNEGRPMKNQILISGKKYRGKYVALNSFNSQMVVASGVEPVEVVKKAERKGVRSPVIVFVPEKKLAHIY